VLGKAQCEVREDRADRGSGIEEVFEVIEDGGDEKEGEQDNDAKHQDGCEFTGDVAQERE
jgi:hypothetical protein